MNDENKKEIKLPPYITIEASLFTNMNLTNTDIIVYAWIYALSTNEDNHCFAHSDYLCKVTRLKERQLRNCLAKLKKYNYIKISYKGNQRFIKPHIIYFMEKRDEKNDNLKLFDYNWLEEE